MKFQPSLIPCSVLLNAWMLISMVNPAQGLECYSCVTSHGPDCLSSSQVTCSAGQVCSNIVYRRGYSLGLLYTKGCEDELQCIRLANLNTADYCDHAPSDCQHCCSRDLCNASVRVANSHSTVLLVLYVTGWYLVIALFTPR